MQNQLSTISVKEEQWCPVSLTGSTAPASEQTSLFWRSSDAKYSKKLAFKMNAESTVNKFREHGTMVSW